MLHSPLHVYDYLPPMYPEMEEVEAEDTVNGDTKEAEEEASMREISSVMMTAGGFLSPCREGKLPERGKVPVPDPEKRRTGARRHL